MPWPRATRSFSRQAQLAEAARMTQPAIARFEAGGTVPTIPVLERLANALGAELTVRLSPRSSAA
ncbi:helix-turn-helix domain-containing protein [Amycolatopsis sp. NPDC059657]|uniref:helix-turn-helix domain-containing protein n=1 Tax=Amycolatopsis sp. NPDC059657 TaxID=3346899 RepID=UPI00366AD751